MPGAFGLVASWRVFRGEASPKDTKAKPGISTDSLVPLQKRVALGAKLDSYKDFAPPVCHRGTRKIPLSTISTWISDTRTPERLLWLTGLPGTGKSTIVNTVAARCEKSQQLGATFCFSKTTHDCDHITKFATTVAHQLAAAVPHVRRLLEDKLARNTGVLEKPVEVQWEELIIIPLQSLSLKKTQPLVILVDGLDECRSSAEQERVIRLLLRVTELNMNLKVLVSSRLEPSISTALEREGAPSGSIKKLNLDDFPSNQDIALFFKDSCQEIRTQRERTGGMQAIKLPWPTEKQSTTFLDRAGEEFIYASTSSAFIRSPNGEPPVRLEQVLCIPPPPKSHLHSLYAMVLERTSQHFQDLMMDVLALSYCNESSATNKPRSVRSLMNISRFLGRSVDDIRRSLYELYPLLSVPADSARPIEFRHRSFSDYLVNTKNPQAPLLLNGKRYASIAIRCFAKTSAPNYQFGDGIESCWMFYCARAERQPQLLYALQKFDFSIWLSWYANNWEMDFEGPYTTFREWVSRESLYANALSARFASDALDQARRQLFLDSCGSDLTSGLRYVGTILAAQDVYDGRDDSVRWWEDTSLLLEIMNASSQEPPVPRDFSLLQRGFIINGAFFTNPIRAGNCVVDVGKAHDELARSMLALLTKQVEQSKASEVASLHWGRHLAKCAPDEALLKALNDLPHELHRHEINDTNVYSWLTVRSFLKAEKWS
ncbi:hypothetical protein BDN72DRAFT_955986 [Pluteus cervinus]|uniref:Uncharacterized protein n=1 Tax=Pluteus cervinus TaxID=181527 RepID=A0ACD3B8W4_9AGAR|nr:hypothetical protein BDN72DRAFT_955986 [Pluteus cervinus]